MTKFSLFIIEIICVACCEECDVIYLREPVSSVRCNPYDGRSYILLKCVIQAPASAGPRLDIVWLFTNTSGHTVNINTKTFSTPPLVSITSQNRTVMNGELIEIASNITLGNFSHPTDAGRYFCLVRLDRLTSSLSFSTAQMFTDNKTIFSEDVCGSSGDHQFSQTTTRCAGNISSFATSETLVSTVSSASLFQSTFPIFTSPSCQSKFLPLTATVKATNSTQFTPDNDPVSMWVYALASVATVFFVIITVLTILLAGFYFQTKSLNCYKQSSNQTDVFIATNTAYETSTAVVTDLNEAYEMADLQRNDAYQQHLVENDAEYLEIIN